MGTALIYLLVVVAVAAAVFGLASAVFGRGEELAPLPPGATPTRLPVGDVEAWAHALVTIVRDDASREEMSRRGRERAAGFTWVVSAHAHAAAFAAAIDAS